MADTFNRTIDLGHLACFDTSSVAINCSEQDIHARAVENIKTIFAGLYNELKTQVGANYEHVDLSKGIYNISFPKPQLALPRALPIPKPKPLTKWEKFQKEKSIGVRARRSRMVWSEEAKDWVPRWGKGRLFNKKREEDSRKERVAY